MTIRHRIGLGVPPILLRLALAVTFIWAGSAKYWGNIDLAPEQESTLQSIRAATPPAPPAPADETDVEPLPEAGEPTAQGQDYVLLLAQNSQPIEDPEQETFTGEDPSEAATDEATRAASSPYHGVHLLAVMIHDFANPDDQGDSLLPGFMGNGKWPLWTAHAVSVVELLGGIFILLGLMTRLASLGIACVMIGAMWLTVIGPVVVYGQPSWGLLPIMPAIENFTSQAWQSFVQQFTLLMAALSLMSLGAGRFSMDRLFFGKSGAPRIEAVVEEEV